MKKKIVLSFIFCLMAFFAFSNDKESNITIDVAVETTNIADSEAVWLVPTLSQKIEANISKYTDFEIINRAKQKEIFKEQAKWESFAYEQNEELEIGKVKNASHRFNVNVLKIPEGYQVNTDITNLVTGVKIATANCMKKNVQNLYSANGSAIDDVTVTLCEQMGIPLSVTEKSFLRYGEASLSEEERSELYSADEKFYSEMIAEMNKEIELLSVSTSLESSIKQKQYEAEKLLAEEKLRVAQENRRRAEEDLKKRKEYEQANASRDAAVTEKINTMAKEAAAKAKKIRDAKLESKSLLGQIQIIELKKAAVLDMYKKLDTERNLITKKASEDLAKKKESIYDEKTFKAFEKGPDGKPSAMAIKSRDFQFKAAEKSIIEARDSDIKQIETTLNGPIIELLNEIDRESRNLSKKKITTLGDELIVSYEPYDYDKLGWTLNVTIKSDNIVLFQTKSLLSYESLTGLKPVTQMETEEDFIAYQDYMANIDMYTSLFLRKEPVLVFELEYYVIPMMFGNPSQYNFEFSNFSYYDMKTLNVQNGNLSSENHALLNLESYNNVKQMTPIHDMTPLKSLLDFMSMEKVNKYPVEELAGTTGSVGIRGKYISFGVWPQSLKEDDVVINEDKIEKINNWSTYKGSDGWNYIKVTANAFLDGYKFDNGTPIENGKDYYFKVEPIKWRLVTNDYNGNKLLLSEKVLASSTFSSDDFNFYQASGLDKYLNEEFFVNAFSKEAQKYILSTNIKNDDVYKEYYESNSLDPDFDTKVFILSEEEILNNEYKFGEYDKPDFARARKATDYAKALGAYVSTLSKSSGNSWWWLRTPIEDFTNYVKTIGIEGEANSFNMVSNSSGGIVPSIVISK